MDFGFLSSVWSCLNCSMRAEYLVVTQIPDLAADPKPFLISFLLAFLYLIIVDIINHYTPSAAHQQEMQMAEEIYIYVYIYKQKQETTRSAIVHCDCVMFYTVKDSL